MATRHGDRCIERHRLFPADELASRGYDIIVAAAGERISSAAQALASHGTEIIEVQTDLSTRGGIDGLWSRAKAVGRPVQIACLNAGVGVGGLLGNRPQRRTQHGRTELHRTVHLAKHVIRQMKEHGAAGFFSPHLLLERWSLPVRPSMLRQRHSSYHSRTAFDMLLL